MAKTSCRFLRSTITKKEECEDEPKQEKELLHSTNTATKTRNKITKNRNSIQARNAEVKSENVDDSKALLACPKKKAFIRANITAEQIAKLIFYVESDKMNPSAAARKVGMAVTTAHGYYREYKNDPEHKLPLPKIILNKQASVITQEKIDNLIRYVVDNGMNITQASKKVGISNKTAAEYYAKYEEDPERKIPLLADNSGNRPKRCTKEEIADLIGYIVRDKMTVFKASKKANMSPHTARKYYLQYLHNPNHKIPDPYESNQRHGRPCTDDQISSLIGYIVNDGMTLLEASVKAHMSTRSASKYYKQYLDDPGKSIPTTGTNNSRVSTNPPTVDQIKSFFCYIIIDKSNIAQAAGKAKISEGSGYKYYTKYLRNPDNEIKIQDMSYSVEKMKQFVKLVENKKMSVSAAADAVHLSVNTARKYYKQYLKDPQYEFPVNLRPQHTQEDIKKLIDHIKRDKMSVCSAAKEIKMGQKAAFKYYKEYKNDPEHRIPVPTIRSYTKKIKAFDKYVKIIADIYKNNPSIKPIYASQNPELDATDIEVKKELMEENDKMILKIVNI